MSIRHFRIFIAVAEEENITKAAKKLYLTQPTVSVAIKEIEEHYGARFFEGINQRLHITEEGKRFLDYAKHFIAMYDEMEIAFKNTDFTGRLRVGASVNIGTYYIPRLIREFRDRYPGINVQVKKYNRCCRKRTVRWKVRSGTCRGNDTVRTYRCRTAIL